MADRQLQNHTELIYTALTRARALLIVIGPPGLLNTIREPQPTG